MPEDFVWPKHADDGGMWPVSKTLTDPGCWVLGEKYFDDLYAAIGDEPGLLFWDISNEPGYRMPDNATWYPEEPEWAREFALPLDDAQRQELRRRQELVWAFIRHFCRYVKSKDPVNAIGVGQTFVYETEASGTGELVDIIVFHDYFETRSRIHQTYKMAVQLGKKYGKPVINNETCCLCRANPYDMVLQTLDEYKMGYYLFELMIGGDVWNRVHGICYPDGTVRDPSIVAALYGFYRNRGESALSADVNQEGYARRAIVMADKALQNARNGVSFRPGGDQSNDASGLLEVCEYIANLLEGGQHVAEDALSTARVAAYRRQKNPNTDEIKTWLCELVDALKKACHLVK